MNWSGKRDWGLRVVVDVSSDFLISIVTSGCVAIPPAL